MPAIDIDLKPVSHITTDAIGQPGKRVFYLQGWQDEKTVTLIIEKFQVQTLAMSIDQFFKEISERFPELPEAAGEFEEQKMRISPPVDPLFRIGEMGLGYDADEDLVVLVAREITAEEGQSEEANVVRFWCTRSQILKLCKWGLELSSRGRPICSQCGEPMDPQGHFCPKKNGHKH